MSKAQIVDLICPFYFWFVPEDWPPKPMEYNQIICDNN